MTTGDIIAAFQDMRAALIAAGIPDDENLHALAAQLVLAKILTSIKLEVVLT